MNALAIYAVGVLVVALFGLVVVYNFIRFRFTGDRTYIFLTLFVVFFVASIIFTLVQYTQVGGTIQPQTAIFQ